MLLKYLSVAKILSPNLKSARLSLSYLNSFYRLWPKLHRAETTQGLRKLAETTHLPMPKRPTLKIGQNEPGQNDPGRNDPGRNDPDSDLYPNFMSYENRNE